MAARDARIATLVAQQLAEVLLNVVQQLQQIPNHQPNQAEPSSSKGKRKAKSYADATPVSTNPKPSKKPYKGAFPMCPTCQYHQPTHYPCRKCNLCGRFGHLVATCQMMPQNNQHHQTNQPAQTELKSL